ncbi:unnamed protein product [Rangifer tarandus platyrhynchus]|uniref:Uncharacterized protein n=1 Tax=Rangifer tarandus platyrhynchus TaxID=3082113 RepID=A0ABN8Y0Z0_RANTA|nr:unnamed protein product [Rangifer tarandus platyrhynchus]
MAGARGAGRAVAAATVTRSGKRPPEPEPELELEEPSLLSAPAPTRMLGSDPGLTDSDSEESVFSGLEESGSDSTEDDAALEEEGAGTSKQRGRMDRSPGQQARTPCLRTEVASVPGEDEYAEDSSDEELGLDGAILPVLTLGSAWLNRQPGGGPCGREWESPAPTRPRPSPTDVISSCRPGPVRRPSQAVPAPAWEKLRPGGGGLRSLAAGGPLRSPAGAADGFPLPSGSSLAGPAPARCSVHSLLAARRRLGFRAVVQSVPLGSAGPRGLPASLATPTPATGLRLPLRSPPRSPRLLA